MYYQDRTSKQNLCPNHLQWRYTDWFNPSYLEELSDLVCDIDRAKKYQETLEKQKALIDTTLEVLQQKKDRIDATIAKVYQKMEGLESGKTLPTETQGEEWETVGQKGKSTPSQKKRDKRKQRNSNYRPQATFEQKKRDQTEMPKQSKSGAPSRFDMPEGIQS